MVSVLKVHSTFGRFLPFLVNMRLSSGEPRMGARFCVSSAGDRHALRQIKRWANSLVEDGYFKDFTEAFGRKRLARFPKFWDKTKDGLSQLWSGENLWLHPPDELWEQTVQKLKFEQGQGIAMVPTCKDRDWWWSLSKVVVDWMDVPRGEPLFVDKYGKVCSADRDYWVVLVDALGRTP